MQLHEIINLNQNKTFFFLISKSNTPYFCYFRFFIINPYTPVKQLPLIIHTTPNVDYKQLWRALKLLPLDQQQLWIIDANSWRRLQTIVTYSQITPVRQTAVIIDYWCQLLT